MATREPAEGLWRLAREQAGVLTRAQVRRFDRHGKPMRRWIRGWTTMAPGLYCVTPPSWLSWCWAGLLRAGETGVISGSAAAHLYGFDKREPGTITIYHQRKRSLVAIGGDAVRVVFKRAAREGRLTPRRTSVEVALVDLARGSSADEVVHVAARALAERLTVAEKLTKQLDATDRARHQAVLRQLCAESSAGVESVLEWWFQQRVIRPHRIPEPARQVPLVARTRSDCVWEEFRLVAELDGRLGHEESFRDMSRDNRLAIGGYTTLRYGWDDVTGRACAVAAEVLDVLRSRGWAGGASRCGDCA
ncbi:DUF559 domain-containing protein [Tessaracoccus sp. OS52]|uniref:DUF559 domain-containing protein n=1 Tax=Tessaracoccus sp. OS52 TaxID=2886691 RepID=UPI001D11123C|nr:DUF559 domain-containing protein [Tessaracoccus sp. OS52]MCC2591942.1 DUF559 domain-containing protein [Tessaracoccus sp. OS52]